MLNNNLSLSSLIAALMTVVFLASCEEPLDSQPSPGDLTGTWVCDELPDGFLKGARITDATSSSIALHADGSFTTKTFPLRNPYRTLDISGKWRIEEPGSTPSGKWSISLESAQQIEFIKITKKGEALYLHCGIDHKYRAVFIKR